VKTTKYHKWCFDQIQGISEDNKELTAEVDRLRKLLETAEKDQVEIESQRLNAILQLGQKERERTGNIS
jgi:regulator of replication initiation timing